MKSFLLTILFIGFTSLVNAETFCLNSSPEGSSSLLTNHYPGSCEISKVNVLKSYQEDIGFHKAIGSFNDYYTEKYEKTITSIKTCNKLSCIALANAYALNDDREQKDIAFYPVNRILGSRYKTNEYSSNPAVRWSYKIDKVIYEVASGLGTMLSKVKIANQGIVFSQKSDIPSKIKLSDEIDYYGFVDAHPDEFYQNFETNFSDENILCAAKRLSNETCK